MLFVFNVHSVSYCASLRRPNDACRRHRTNYCNRWHHPQNRKYVTLHAAGEAGPIHGMHSQHAQIIRWSLRVWLLRYGDLQTDRQTDSLPYSAYNTTMNNRYSEEMDREFIQPVNRSIGAALMRVCVRRRGRWAWPRGHVTRVMIAPAGEITSHRLNVRKDLTWVGACCCCCCSCWCCCVRLFALLIRDAEQAALDVAAVTRRDTSRRTGSRTQRSTTTPHHDESQTVCSQCFVLLTYYVHCQNDVHFNDGVYNNNNNNRW